MKKDKPGSPEKSEKKKARKTIQERLVTELKAITGEFAKKAEKVGIDIEKEAKKLAKKISKGLKPADDKEKDKASAIKVVETAAKNHTAITTAKPAQPVAAKAFKTPAVKAARPSNGKAASPAPAKPVQPAVSKTAATAAVVKAPVTRSKKAKVTA